MEVKQILEWLVAWGLLLFAQSVFINGVYQSATGETKKRVDGSDEDSEMILYPLKKFFERTQSRGYKYKGHALRKLLMDTLKGSEDKYAVVKFGEIKYDKIEYIKDQDANQDFSYFSSMSIPLKSYSVKRDGRSIYFFKQYEEYKYTKWLRKPIIQCIKCMSSFWGALTFWPIVLFLFGFHWLEIPVFFADIFSLTYLNWILYKKAQ